MTIAIFNKAGAKIRDIEPDDSSSRIVEIMGDNELTLHFSLTEYVEFPVMSWCTYRDEKYYLFAPCQWKEHSRYNWEYTLVMGSNQYMLGKIKVRSLLDIPKRLKFTLWGTPQEFVKLIVDSMNASDPAQGWLAGSEMVSAERQTLDFNCESCSDALKKVSDAFDTEWEVIGKQINLKRVEKDKANPIACLRQRQRIPAGHWARQLRQCNGYFAALRARRGAQYRPHKIQQ